MEKIKMPFAGKYPMTQDYGVKVSYMRCGYHTGIDWGLPKGTPLIACFAGKVIKAARYQLTGYGREIQIERDDGLVAQYGHCSDILVEVGTKVEAGTILGHSGNSGFVISLGGGGYHLHFGTMKKDKWFDPKEVLDGNTLPLEYKAEETKKETTEPIQIEVKDEDKVVAESEVVHVVQKGDTLSKLAKQYLGNGNLWPKIFEINADTIANPNKIKVGQNIKIPNVKK